MIDNALRSASLHKKVLELAIDLVKEDKIRLRQQKKAEYNASKSCILNKKEKTMKVVVWHLAEPMGAVETNQSGQYTFDPYDNKVAQQLKDYILNCDQYYKLTKEAKTSDDVLSILAQRANGYWEVQEVQRKEEK